MAFGDIWRLLALVLVLVSISPILLHCRTAARRAYLVVPEIGVLKWFLESSSIASVNLESECRF